MGRRGYVELNPGMDRDRSDAPYEPSYSTIILAKSEVPDSEERTKPSHPTWFWSSVAGLGLAVVVLVINIVVFVWVRIAFSQDLTLNNNIARVLSTSCSTTSRTMIFIELAINTLSTLLLTASNNCVRLMLSPTRSEVDRAHAAGKWLCIGVPGFRNLKWISWWRLSVCFFLFISSIPLHLLYNSIIFSSSYANDFMAAAVTQEFESGAQWDPIHAMTVVGSYGQGALDQLKIMQENGLNFDDWEMLPNQLCMNSFGSGVIKSPYLNVMVVTTLDKELRNDSFINAQFHLAEDLGSPSSTDESWFRSTRPNPDNCPYPDNVIMNQTSANWSVPIGGCQPATNKTNFLASESNFLISMAGPFAQVRYCRAQKASNYGTQCTISISATLLIAVIACNIFKVICFAIVLFARGDHPLATVGDSICSFMRRPDSTTSGMALISLSSLREFYPRKKDFASDFDFRLDTLHTWEGVRHKWGLGIRSPACILGMIFIWFAYLGTLVPMVVSWGQGGLLASWDQDAAIASSIGILSRGNKSSLLSLVMAINAPQLIVSLVYVFYTNLIVRLATTWEYSQYGRVRQGLRVSQPSGQQRPAHLSGIAFKYNIPIWIGMMLLHWLISRGTYLVNVKVYNIAGVEVPSRETLSSGTSSLALLFAFILGTIMWIILFGLCFRMLGEAIPIMGVSSAAISAACHPVEGDEDAYLKKVIYGVVPGEPLDILGTKHTCFTSGKAEMLEIRSRYQ